MSAPSTASAPERASIIAFLSRSSLAQETVETPTVAGDPAYGEYLAGECVTCHRLSGENGEWLMVNGE